MFRKMVRLRWINVGRRQVRLGYFRGKARRGAGLGSTWNMFEGPVCASLLVFHVKHKHTGPFHVEHTPMMLQPRYSGYFGLGLARLRDLRTGAAFSPPSRAASGAARLKPGSAFIAFT